MEPKHTIKAEKCDFSILCVGGPGSGKTSLIKNHAFLNQDDYGDPHEVKVYTAYLTFNFGGKEQEKTFKFIDTPSTFTTEDLTKPNMKNIKAIFVCADLSSAASSEIAQYWLYASHFRYLECFLLLIGTKEDLVPKSKKQEVHDQLKKVAEIFQASYLPISTLKGSHLWRKIEELYRQSKQFTTKVGCFYKSLIKSSLKQAQLHIPENLTSKEQLKSPKILVVGGRQSGKKSLISKYVDGKMPKQQFQKTSFRKDCKSDGDITLHVEFNLVSEDEFSEKIHQKNYHGVNLVLLCLDCSEPYDASMIKKWMEKILIPLGNDKSKVLLLGTKYDLSEKGDDSLIRYAAEASKRGLEFCEVSALKMDAKSLDFVFQKAFDIILGPLKSIGSYEEEKRESYYEVPSKKRKTTEISSSQEWKNQVSTSEQKCDKNAKNLNDKKKRFHLGRCTILVIGEAYSGKKSFVKRSIEGTFTNQYQPHLKESHSKRSFDLDEYYTLDLEMVSVGSDKYHEKARQDLYPNANLIILCLDCSKPYDDTLIDKWLKEIYFFVDKEKAKIIMVGTKYDLVDKIRVGGDELYTTEAYKKGFELYPCSAKDEDDFDFIIEKGLKFCMFKDYDKGIKIVKRYLSAPKFYIGVLGDHGVGKAKVHEILFGENLSEVKFETGLDHCSGYLYLHNSKNELSKVILLELSGKQEYRSLIPTQIKQASGFLICFNLEKRSTFKNIVKYLGLIKDYKIKEIYNINIILIAIGNKDHSLNNVTIEEAQGFAKKVRLDFQLLELEKDKLSEQCQALVRENYTQAVLKAAGLQQ